MLLPILKIYIILPAYNEEASIGKLLIRIAQSMQDAKIDNFEIIVVNDGSSDRTLEIARALSQEIPIIILSHEINQGLGATIRDGLYEASEVAKERDIIITMDADDTHTPGLILRMIRMIMEGHDVVIASRYKQNSRIKGLSIYRQLLSFGASWLFRIFFPIKGVKDFTCGFRAYRGDVLKKAISMYGDTFIDQEGFQCMVDILLKLRKLDLIFGEVPFILRYDKKESKSKMDILDTIKNTLILIFRRIIG